MKRFWIMLLVIAVAIVIALPVSAKPPLCSENSEHPACIPDPTDPPPDNEPIPGETCYALGYWESEPVTGDFQITLGGDHPHEYCIDVVSTFGDWEITVIPGGGGKILSLNLFLRDSFSPGDGCVCVMDDGKLSCGHCGYTFRSKTLPSDPVLFRDTPGATVNACGTDFAEYVGSYWADEDGIEVFHRGELVTTSTDNESPLSFLPSMRGTGDATVTLTVDLPVDALNDPYDITPIP